MSGTFHVPLRRREIFKIPSTGGVPACPPTGGNGGVGSPAFHTPALQPLKAIDSNPWKNKKGAPEIRSAFRFSAVARRLEQFKKTVAAIRDRG
jgi:hypothetical protein